MGQVSPLDNRIAVFNKGSVEQPGPSMERYNRPVNTFMAAFIGAPRIDQIARPPPADAAAPHCALSDAFAGRTVALAPDAGWAMIFGADDRLIN